MEKINDTIKIHKIQENLGKKVEQEQSIKKKLERLKELLSEREEFETVDILEKIIENTNSEQLKKVANIFLSNPKLIENSTILSGPTANGLGIGQTTIEGTIKNITNQVYMTTIEAKKEDNENTDNPFIMKVKSNNNKDVLDRTVLHELLHSFTNYLVLMDDENLDKLYDYEIEFLEKIKALYNDFINKYKTGDSYLDSLDEFIAKTITITDNWNGSKYQDKATEIFKKMYLENNRNIVSLSKKLKNKNLK